MVGLGASLAVFRVVQDVPRWQAQRWANASLLTMLGGLIGARLVFVFIHWLYYKNHLLEILALWHGGYSWIGAVLGGAAVILSIVLRWHIPAGKIADHLAFMLPPLTVSIWLGCWLAGYAYGPAAPDGAFWGVPCRDESGVLAMRFPLQFAGAAGMLLYSFWLETRKHGDCFDGWRALWMVLGLSINILLFTALRADVTPTWYGARLDTWASLLLLFICLTGLIWGHLQYKTTHAVQEENLEAKR